MAKVSEERRDSAEKAKPEVRLSPNDPGLAAINKMAEHLEPFDRRTQLEIMASVCVRLQMYDEAQRFVGALRSEYGDDE